jgi:hypothetical protein
MAVVQTECKAEQEPALRVTVCDQAGRSRCGWQDVLLAVFSSISSPAERGPCGAHGGCRVQADPRDAPIRRLLRASHGADSQARCPRRPVSRELAEKRLVAVARSAGTPGPQPGLDYEHVDATARQGRQLANRRPPVILRPRRKRQAVLLPGQLPIGFPDRRLGKPAN